MKLFERTSLVCELWIRSDDGTKSPEKDRRQWRLRQSLSCLLHHPL